jgi:hypothetical protein
MSAGLYGATNSPYIVITGSSDWTSTTATSPHVTNVRIEQDAGISPILYFKYVKSKFRILERMKLDRRLKRLDKAFDEAVEAGQDALAKKFLIEVVRETRESAMLAKGFRFFIEKADLSKYKHRIRGGHISDTKLEDYTRVIPKDVLAKKKHSEGLFDGYVIYHYWNEQAEDNRTKKQKLTEDEKQKMRDPVLFGTIHESDRLYFVADWEDEHCDLTFDEIVDVLGKSEDEVTIPKQPSLSAPPR